LKGRGIGGIVFWKRLVLTATERRHAALKKELRFAVLLLRSREKRSTRTVLRKTPPPGNDLTKKGRNQFWEGFRKIGALGSVEEGGGKLRKKE